MRLVSSLLFKSNFHKYLTRFKDDGPILYLESVKNRQKNFIYKLFTDFNQWYTRTLGLDEVRLFQDRVVALQEKLLQTQEQRREIGRHLAETRKKSNLLQDELHKVQRHNDIERFLTLMREETEVLKMEKEIAATFQEYDVAERELFTAFSNAIRDSHEKQRAQLEYTKYFGIILSIAGSFLAFCYTSFTKSDMKNFISNVLQLEVSKLRDEQGEMKSFYGTLMREQIGSLINVVKTNNESNQKYFWQQKRKPEPLSEQDKDRMVLVVGGILLGLYLLGVIVGKSS